MPQKAYPKQGNYSFYEVDFTIKIGNENTSFKEVQSMLSNYFLPYSNYSNEGVIRGRNIELFIKSIIEGNPFLQDYAHVYVVRFREKSGSYILTFTLVIITTFITYGSIRRAISTLIDDITSILSVATEGMSIKVEEETREIISAQPTEKRTSLRGYLSSAWIGIIAFFLSLIGAIFLIFNTREVDSPQAVPQIDTCEMEKIINYKVDEILRNKKLDYIYEQVRRQNDTLAQ